MKVSTFIFLAVVFLVISSSAQSTRFVRVEGGTMMRDRKPYTFVGTNYWYGSLLGLEKDRRRGIGRLRSELDFLKANGITNLRLMAGAEGSGLLNGIVRVGPSLQPENGRFDESVLKGLDIILDEMSRRKMTAVIFFSNNWEWSGGFQQYLIWNKVISDDWREKKPDWDQLRDIVSQFYSCEPCMKGYEEQVRLVVNRTNGINGRKYVDDPTIMAWELANEPRPMRPAADERYKQWISRTAKLIKSLDRNHMVTTGHEGWIGTQSIELFEEAHAFPEIDYLTIHIWPKNWAWFADKKLAEEFSKAKATTEKYIAENLAVARRLNKPLVIEEFGLPRDGQSFSPTAPTTLRDDYFRTVFSYIGRDGIAGANFWAFGGKARPRTGQLFWKSGDEYMGDPPMEEQGLYTVFDSDASTWKVIRAAGRTAR